MSPQLDSLRMSESYFLLFMGIVTKLALLIHMPTLSIFFSPSASFFRLPQLEGETSVPFVDGVAEFTRLRVDREASRLSLSFTTLPERFQSETSIEFSVVPFHDSVERKQVSFLLTGVPVPDSMEWNGDSVIEEVVRGVGVALDVDPSRIKDVILQELDWVCHYLFTSVQDKSL